MVMNNKRKKLKKHKQKSIRKLNECVRCDVERKSESTAKETKTTNVINRQGEHLSWHKGNFRALQKQQEV